MIRVTRVLRLAAIRAQQAELLGAADYASWALTDQMAASRRRHWALCAG